MLGLGMKSASFVNSGRKAFVATNISGTNGVVKTRVHHLFWRMTTKQNQNRPQTLYPLLVFFQISVYFLMPLCYLKIG
jgi:hypothetical protein